MVLASEGALSRLQAGPLAPSAVLLERAGETEALEEALASVQAACRGQCVLVEGPPGIGKTSLLEVAADRAAGRGFGILTARGAALESDFAFGLARALFEPALRSMDDSARGALLADLGTPAAAIFPGLVESGFARTVPDATAAAAVVLALHELTVALSAERALLIVADDVHWSDEPSLRFLAYLARRLPTLPVLLVLAARPIGEWSAPVYRSSLLREAGSRPLRPRPLSVAGVGDVIRRATDQPTDAAFALACRRVTGGNPFYLVELLRTLTERGIDPMSTRAIELPSLAPGGVALSIVERLDRLPPESLEVARAVAVVGDDCPLPWIVELTGLDADVAGAASDALRTVAILGEQDDLSFVHPILATTVYHAIPPARRAAMHGTCAEVARRRHAPAEMVAAHLLRTIPRGHEAAVDALQVAAAEALGRGSPRAAVTYLRRAIEEPPADRSHVLVQLGVAEGLARDDAAAAHLGEAVVTAADPDDLVTAGLALWSTNSFDGRIADGLDMLRDVQRRSGGAAPELAARLELELARATRSLRSTAAEGRERIAGLLRRSAGGDRAMPRVGFALAAYDAVLANEPAAGVLELLEQALPLDDAILGRSESALLHLPFYTLIYCDAYDRLWEVLAGFEAAVARRGSAIGAVVADCWATLTHLRAGALRQAEERGAKAFAGALERGWLFGKVAAQTFLAEVAVERGDIRAAVTLGQAARELIESDPDVDDKGWWDHASRGRALTALAAGEPSGALSLLLEIGRRHDAWDVHCPSELPWRSDAALAAQATGDAALAARLAQEELELARHFGARRALGIALRVHGVVSGSESSLREATACLEGSPARLEHARAQCDLGALLRSKRQDPAARAVLHESHTMAEELGALALARRARSELRAAGGRPRAQVAGAAHAMSSAEVRIVHLAARGMSNPEIAKTLVLSRRTVETHLYNAYRKLGVKSREDLAGALAAPRPAPV